MNTHVIPRLPQEDVIPSENVVGSSGGEPNVMPVFAPTAVRWVTDRYTRNEIGVDTANKYREVLLRFAAHVDRDIPIAHIRQHHIDDWLADQTLSPATTRGYLSVLKVFFAWATAAGHCRKDPTVGIRPPKVPRALPRRVDRDFIAGLFDACGDQRERLMVSLALNEGLRVSEIAKAELGDIDWHNRLLLVHGKGGHERVLPITARTWRELVGYIGDRRTAGPLLRSERPTRDRDGIGPRRVCVLVAAVMRRAGIAESGHALRHTAAAETLEAGANIRQVQAMLGHASVSTTTRYLGPVDAEGLRTYMNARQEVNA